MNSAYFAIAVVYAALVLLLTLLLASLFDDNAKYRASDDPYTDPPRHIPLGVAFSERERLDAKRERKQVKRRVGMREKAPAQKEEAFLRQIAKALSRWLDRFFMGI